MNFQEVLCFVKKYDGLPNSMMDCQEELWIVNKNDWSSRRIMDSQKVWWIISKVYGLWRSWPTRSSAFFSSSCSFFFLLFDRRQKRMINLTQFMTWILLSVFLLTMIKTSFLLMSMAYDNNFCNQRCAVFLCVYVDSDADGVVMKLSIVNKIHQ